MSVALPYACYFQMNKKYVLSKSESVQCYFFIWNKRNVTFIQFKICCCVQNFIKIGWRNGDITIFKMAAVRHRGIVLLPYEITHEVSVAGRSCLSNFMSMWYTVLKIIAIWIFAYLAWNAYSGPQNGGFGGLWTPKCDYSLSRPPKGTSLRKSASLKLSTVERPLRGLTCRRVDKKCDEHTHTQVNLYSVHALHSIGQTINAYSTGEMNGLQFINAVDLFAIKLLI